MGTWGLNNLDSDSAQEVLDSVVIKLVAIIQDSLTNDKLMLGNYLEHFGENKLLPAMDILITLCEHYETPTRLEDEDVRIWKQKHLEVFDRDIGLYYAPETAAKRRTIVEATFDHLITLVDKWRDVENR